MIGGVERTQIAWPKATARGMCPLLREVQSSILQSEWEAKKRSIATLKNGYRFSAKELIVELVSS